MELSMGSIMDSIENPNSIDGFAVSPITMELRQHVQMHMYANANTHKIQAPRRQTRSMRKKTFRNSAPKSGAIVLNKFALRGYCIFKKFALRGYCIVKIFAPRGYCIKKNCPAGLLY